MVLRRNKSGFSLVELLVALAITSIVLTMMYQTYRSQLKSHTTQQELVEMQQNMRGALYLMEREIRMAGYAPEGGLPPAPITLAETDRMRFSMDLTMDGDTSDIGERITYRRTFGDGNPLIRDDENGAGEQNLLEAADIEDLEFIYKDEDGQTISDAQLATVPGRSSIRSVEIILNASIGTTVMVAPHQMELRSEVKIRNLGLSP